MVTAGTYLKAQHFRTKERLDVLQRGILRLSSEFDWQLEAWAVFSNHYHFIGHSPRNVGASSLSEMLGTLHRRTATWLNRIENKPGRKIWYNYWETRLTFERSYFARLHYVHANAVRHGVVISPNLYPWCSAGWFERTATPAQVKTLESFKMDTVNVVDDYQVVAVGY